MRVGVWGGECVRVGVESECGWECVRVRRCEGGRVECIGENEWWELNGRE